SFRNVGEITELAGCDLLTIAPNLLKELQSSTGDLPRRLDPAKASAGEKVHLDDGTFRAQHAEDRMAKERLDEGIQGFSKAIVALEKLLAERLKALLGHARSGSAAREFFRVFDL